MLGENEGVYVGTTSLEISQFGNIESSWRCIYHYPAISLLEFNPGKLLLSCKIHRAKTLSDTWLVIVKNWNNLNVHWHELMDKLWYIYF